MVSLRKIAFWMGVIAGVAIGYAIGISLPEDKQQQLREELQKRGKEVVTKGKEVGEQYARDWAEEARKRATEWFQQAETHIPYSRSRTNGHEHA